MTTAISSTPPTSLIWQSGKPLHRDLPGPDVGRLLRGAHDTEAWIFLPRSETHALTATAEHLEIDHLAVEDLLADNEGLKLEWLGTTMVAVSAHAAFQQDPVEVVLTPVSLLAGHRVLVILTEDRLRPELCKALESRRSEVLEAGIPAALHAVLDVLVDGYQAVLSRLQDQAEALSDKLFDDKPLARAEQLQAFALRRALTKLRRLTAPMRTITAGLANAARRQPGAEPSDPAEELLGTRTGREFSDVADHANHIAADAELLREEISSMYETNLALADVHLNMVMKKLSGWAAIIAVPTFITGFMGMNVNYPGFGTTVGFIVASLIMVTVVALLYRTFRRKDWL